jgi:hypothetical protein
MVHGDNPIRDKQIGFLVLTNQGAIDCSVYPDSEPRSYYILLYHLGYHWKLAGYAIEPDKVQVIFPAKQIPKVIKDLYESQCHMINEYIR